MRAIVPAILCLLATGCLTTPTAVTRPQNRSTNGCTRVAPPDVRPNARFHTRVTTDMNEWCEKIAATARRLGHTI